MANIDITVVSSKGQIVIPRSLRKGINSGDRLVVMRSDDLLVIKKADKFAHNISEDLEFAKRTEHAWDLYGQGKFKSKSKEKFLSELEKW
ncbi:AbrB/MazE/SpoVT family DNA-binding domain-containing protein [Candidatus Micrarchaeota archaeon]|nr:AbrB/MazE/SpoVT family DNA-binding domain-containing protein [Candidatus Micrarchaeota archaeon]